MSFARLKFAPHHPGTGEILDVLGPRLEFLTPMSDNDGDYCLIRGMVPAGVVVPIHSHAEQETIYVLEGKIEGLCEDRWIGLAAGDIFDVPGGVKHGWRNVSRAPAYVLVVTQMRLARFLHDVARPIAQVEPGPPRPADLQRFFERAHSYGYWIGTRADNAAVGLSFC